MGKFSGINLADLVSIKAGSSTLSAAATNAFLANPNGTTNLSSAATAAPPLTLGGHTVTAPAAAPMLGSHPVVSAPAVAPSLGASAPNLFASGPAPATPQPPPQKSFGPPGAYWIPLAAKTRAHKNYAPDVFPWNPSAAFPTISIPREPTRGPHLPGNQTGWFDMLSCLASPKALYNGQLKLDMAEMLVLKSYITMEQAQFLLNGYVVAMDVDGPEYLAGR